MIRLATSPLMVARGIVLYGVLQMVACGSSPETSDATGVGGHTTVAGASGSSSAGASGTPGTAGASGGAGSGGAGSGGAGSGGGIAGVGGGGGAAGVSAAGSGGGMAGAGGGAGALGGRGGKSGSSGSAGATTDGGASDAAVSFLPCLTATCAVMPLGDSITEGYPANAGGYRVELFRQAVTNARSLTFVGTLMNGPANVESRPFPQRHQGHRGYTIDTAGSDTGISGQLVDQAIAGQKPQIVLLMIGTNDVNRSVDVASAPTRLGKLIDEIIADAPAALVVVSTIIPINDSAGNTRAQAYNAAIPALVSARAAAGKHVVFLDAYTAFVRDPNYKTTLMADSLHPNDAGYAVLGRAFFDVIRALLPSGT